ncbi:hypothetical protein LMG27952_02630 [Paraburkholderia hiiakae]|uniref:DISARM protein DrmE C-terminal domain-containing protein n=1 Tax=Paraburkholderia hiiakae TaxID=1081782 RepID=A0ABN7HQV2_9BURK|nr:hypothetical protein LMG27952_02630 [Paraburkholderia hiiakae]
MNLPGALVQGASESWLDLVEQSWPAVTASDLLRGNAEIWKHDGLNVPKHEEAVALAMMGRLVRFGQSVRISLPIGQGSLLSQVAFYLHRLRLDAAGGLLRSTWLNPVSIEHRGDLVVFGRSRNMLRAFSTSAVMRPQFVSANAPVEPSVLQRTLLVSGQDDLLEVLELLVRNARPFAIVVDASPHGCHENALSLIKVLPEYFESVPVVVLTCTGQVVLDAAPMHAWNTRLSDVATLRGSKTQASASYSAIEVVAARDPAMDAFVAKLGFMVWNLKRKLEETGGVSQEFHALLAAERALRCLNVPFSAHEAGMLRHARGGRFPIRTIDSWLDLAARLKGRRGDVQELHAQIMAIVRRMIDDLREAIPGRAEAIVKLCGEALTRREKVSVMVGNRRDAEILTNFLEGRLGLDIVDWLTVSPMDGTGAVAPDSQELVVYAGVLYPSRIHWLGLHARKKIVLCHPFEQERIRSHVTTWWQQHAMPSAPKGDKYRLWGLRWPAGAFLQDELTDGALQSNESVSYNELDIEGIYPVRPRVAQLDAFRGYDDWLDTLLKEPSPIQRIDEPAHEPTRSIVVVQFDGQSDSVRCGANQQIMRMRGDDLELCTARDLNVGDEVVILAMSKERVATQHDLFDMFVENSHGLQQTLRIAQKWQTYVDAGLQTFEGSVVELNKYLKGKRVNVHNSTVQNWAHGGVIGPQDLSAIRALAELAKTANAKQMADMVGNAIAVIRAEHRRIGTDLRRAIAVSRARDVSAVQIGSRSFSRDVFDALVQVAKVTSVERPPHEKVTASSKTIQDVAMEFAMLHPRKVIFTTGCDRGMRTSEFTNIKAFTEVLKVLVEGFYPMYADHSKSLQEVEDMLATIPASYAGGMSDVTKGKHEQHYFRFYEGEKIDISRHIRLGRAFDPRYTMRVHFHWDALRGKIVVHHAGEHLPTLSN